MCLAGCGCGLPKALHDVQSEWLTDMHWQVSVENKKNEYLEHIALHWVFLLVGSAQADFEVHPSTNIK